MKTFKDGKQEYLRIGDKAIPIDRDENGKPVIKPKIEKTIGKDGKPHVKIKIPTMQIRIKSNK